MPQLIERLSIVEATGNVPKRIEEYAERVAICLPVFSPESVHRDA